MAFSTFAGDCVAPLLTSMMPSIVLTVGLDQAIFDLGFDFAFSFGASVSASRESWGGGSFRSFQPPTHWFRRERALSMGARGHPSRERHCGHADNVHENAQRWGAARNRTAPQTAGGRARFGSLGGRA